MQLQKFKALLQEAGVVGAGGAGFPAYAKLSEAVDTVILNCAECEPLLKVHQGLLEAYPYEILSALAKLVESMGAKQGIVAVKAHYQATIAAVESELDDFPTLSLCRLDALYPMGDELILIKEVTGRTVAPGKLPASVGVVVCNVESVYNMHRAMQGYPVTEKYVTVTGEVARPATLLVPIGTRISELIDACGGVTADDVAYLNGGPMMGKLTSPHQAVTKTTNAILVLPANHTVVLNKKLNPSINLRRTMSVCCHCHACTDLCSRNVLGYPVEPHTVMRVLSHDGKGDVKTLAGSLFCSGCGLCETFSCPQGLSPRAMIDELKKAARAQGYKPPSDIPLATVKDAAHKRVSVERLTMRLGLKKYDRPAPIREDFATDSVKVLLSQHIGAPAVAMAQTGDIVQKGDVIATAPKDALGVCIHAPIDGTVVSVMPAHIKIKKMKP